MGQIQRDIEEIFFSRLVIVCKFKVDDICTNPDTQATPEVTKKLIEFCQLPKDVKITKRCCLFNCPVVIDL